MSRLYSKPDHLLKRGDSLRDLSASDFQRIVEAVTRSIVADEQGPIEVRNFGDRIVISWKGRKPVIPAVTNYIRTLLVLQEFDDYLQCCEFFWPEVYAPGIYSPRIWHIPDDLEMQPQSIVYVAKPYLMQRSPWDQQTVEYDDGTFVSYGYTGIGLRDAQGTNGNIETQQITPPYLAGDIIKAACAITGYITPESILPSNVEPILWEDMNSGGRQWAAINT